MFGTYQPEEEQVEYGLTHNIEHKANPFHINFHEYADMMRDVRKAKGFKKKLFYVFGDPGRIAEEKKVASPNGRSHVEAIEPVSSDQSSVISH
jgi:hypothetical protein